MASDIKDFTCIHDEDLLRRMWQQTEDFGLKKEIRTYMYKLREERLRDFYSTGNMDTPGFGPTKTPLAPSHGESLADQSFQSLKTKEIRDSEGPGHEFKIARSGIVPDTSGWNIVTSSEVSPDGRARQTESIATTEGLQQLPDGQAKFAGKNEHMTKVSHQGDDQNFVKTAAEKSATQFQESSVTGDANSGRIESKSSSTTSSSHVTTSKYSSSSGDPMMITPHENIADEFDKLVDSNRTSQQTRSNTVREHQKIETQNQEQHRRHQNEQHRIQHERKQQLTDDSNYRKMTNQNEENLITQHDTRNIQKEVDLLAAQPGVVISRTVDYPDPNTKVITETKSLPDGTTVTTRRYETKSASSQTFRSASNQQHSITSRTTVEDRGQRNRVEYIHDDEINRIKQQQNKADESIRSHHTQNVINNRVINNQNIDTVDRSIRRNDLKAQVEDIVMDNTHRTVKKDLSQKYRNQDFIDTERQHIIDHQPSQNSTYTRTEHITTTKEFDTTNLTRDSKPEQPAAGKPSYNSQKPVGQPTTPREVPSSRKPSGPQTFDITIDTSEYPKSPNYRPQQPDDHQPRCTDVPQSKPAAGKPSYNVQRPAGKPSCTQTSNQTQQLQQTDEIIQSRTERIQTHSDREHDYPAGKPTRPERPHDQDTSVTRSSVSETREFTERMPRPGEREIPITYSHRPANREPDYPDESPSRYPKQSPEPSNYYPTRPYSQEPSTGRPLSRDKEPDYPAGKPSYTRRTNDDVIPREPESFEIPVGRPDHPKYHYPKGQQPSPYRESPNRVMPSTDYGSPGRATPQYIRRPSEESRISSDTITFTNRKISVEVNAAHDAFARSLRCVSPTTDHRGSVKSFRTSNTSVRSSSSPEKRTPSDRRTPNDRRSSRRSPSHDSVAYSESSRISSSTVTKGKVDTTRDTHRSPKKTTDFPSKTKPQSTQPSHRNDFHRSNETIDLGPTKNRPTNNRPVDRKGTPSHHVTKITREVDEYPGEKKPLSKEAPIGQRPYHTSPTKDTLETTTKKTPKTDDTKKTPLTKVDKRPQSNKSYPGLANNATIVTNNKRTTITESITTRDSNKIPKEIPGVNKSHPVAPKVSRSPHSSLERSSRPVQSNREPIYDTPRPTREDISPRFPAGKPSNFTESSTRFTKTVKVDNAIFRDEKTPKTGKTPKGRQPASDDEGFQPESPRSSSPTSSVSDLVYQKCPEERPRDFDETTTNSMRQEYYTTSDEHTTREQENLKTNKTESTFDDSTFERRKYLKDSPDRTPRPSDEEPTDDGDYIVVEDHYTRHSPERSTPKREADYPGDISPIGRNSSPFHSPERDYPHDRSPKPEFVESGSDKEPFYLIEPRKPNDGKKPKLTRSETYEERCRQILGMDRSTTEDSEETVTRRKSSQRDVVDFIKKEQDVEIRNKPQREINSPRSSSPQKYKSSITEPTRKPSKPSRETSPNKFTETEYVFDARRGPGTQPRRDSPRKDSPVQSSPEGSPTRKRTPQDSPRRCSPVKSSPESSPTRNRMPYESPERRSPVKSSPDGSPTRNQTTRSCPRVNSPRKSSPEDSPTRRQTPQDSPRKNAPTSPTQQKKSMPIRKQPSSSSPTRESPERSPVRKSPSAQSPYDMPGGRQVSPSRPTYVKQSEPRTPAARRDSPERKPRKPVERSSPEVSPTRKQPTGVAKPKASEIDRKPKDLKKSPDSSPTRRPTTEQRHSPTGEPKKSYDQSPTRSAKSTPRTGVGSPTRFDYSPATVTETVTITTHRITKDRPTSRSPKDTTESPRRPSHVTTARIHLSPVDVDRKPSSLDTKKSPKKSQTKPAPGTPSSTIVSSTREDTTRLSKSTVPRHTSPQRNIVKLKTDKSKTTEIREHSERVHVKTKTPEENTSGEDSEEVSDTEDITTVIEATTFTTNRNKKHPFTDRKDSAPVYRTTHVDKDKMTRSTSENLIKITTTRRSAVPESDGSPERTTELPRKKSLDKKRPVKCMATKTINLTTTNNIINSEDMEDVIIDIQQAKSSREPSPNRLIPTPVHNDEDMGNLRYPDRVQEPEDETRRRRPKVKDIPIFEENANEFVHCHISEVEEHDETIKRKSSTTRTEKESKTTRRTSLKTSRETSPIKDRSYSPTSEQDDDYRLSVHDKVTKFTTTAEETKKPRPSAPFHREPRPEDFSEPDDCLLSVNDKVTKFTTTAENVTKTSKTSSISKRSERPTMDEIEDDLRDDECILSVSQKVNKFTTDKLSESSPQRSPQLVAKIERQVSRKDDTNEEESATEPEEVKTLPKASIKDRYNPERPKQGERPMPTKTVIPKSSDMVKKVKSVFENGDTGKPKQRDILSRPSVWDSKRKPDVKLEDIGVRKPFDDETEDLTDRERSRSRSPGEIEDEPKIRGSPRTQRISTSDTVSTRRSLFENHNISKTSVGMTRKQTPQDSIVTKNRPIDSKSMKPSEKESPHQRPKDYSPTKNNKGRYPDQGEEYVKEFSSRTTTSKRTETASPNRNHPDEYVTRKPKEVSSPGRREPRKDETSPIRRTGDRYVDQIKSTRRPSDSSPSRTIAHTARSPDYRPSYMEPTISSIEHQNDFDEYTRSSPRQGNIPREFDETSQTSRQNSSLAPNTDGTVPSYMEHTISSIEHRRDSVEINKTHSRRTSHDSLHTTEFQSRPSKFGVELKRTDSHETNAPGKISSGGEIPPLIEEIFDLELLEKMLETVVGYEQRRRIRTQIRVVKKILEERASVTTTTTTTTKVTRKGSDSPVRKTETHITRRIESSPDRKTVSPARKPSQPASNIRSNRFIETESRHITQHEKKSEVRERSVSPHGKTSKTVTSRTITENRRASDKPSGKKPITPQKEDKPIWATKNILKKTSEKDRTAAVKKVSTTKTQRQVITRDDDADCITSSYGIGPTDDEGKPLFGIRALKKKPTQPGETSKVTGSVVTEHYYSENGAPAVGERKVTVYSTNPEDLNDYEDLVERKHKNDIVTHERTGKDGITSVTRIQKVGNRKDTKLSDLPALTDSDTTSITKQSKVSRKGSVKEMSEKFIRKESTSSVTERTSSSSYPKAGLILRTQHYSGTDNNVPDDECNVEVYSTRKQSRTMTESDSETDSRRITKTTKSFLNSDGSKVTGVNDVLDRMRNADNVVEEGDSAEDIEARSLLNKFLGASVLMSGMESMIPKDVVTRTVIESPGKREVKTTRVTKTVTTGSSSPVTRKTCDIEEIWDEEYLKQLLEQTTNYEERRKIRARIRQIMAEKEACKKIVASVKAELQAEQHKKSVKKDIAKETATEATNENSETESEYEEVEYVEEVTDDDSAEGEEVEDNDDDDEEAEVEEEEEEENDDEEEEVEEKDDKKKFEETNKKQEEPKRIPSKAVEVKAAPKQIEKEKPAEKAEEKSSVIEIKKEVKESESQKNREVSTKEQSTYTAETTETKGKDGTVVTTTTKVSTRTLAAAPKPVSPFAKFRQLDKQNSQNSPSSPITPGGTNRGAQLFQFTDPALNARAATFKEQLLQWCQMKTKEYENVQITNFSTSWSDGLAFCALIHHFLPDAFDYTKLSPQTRRYNFELAFRVADEKAGIAPLLDVEDMVVMRKPDWKCVFTYVQSIFRRFRNSA